jgi:hypothetical protein
MTMIGISDEIKLAVELSTFAATVGVMLWRLSAATTTFALIGQQQAQEIREIKMAVEKMESAVTAIAVQDEKLNSVTSRIDVSDKRNDDRFSRMEAMLDDLRHGKGMVRN